MINISHFSFTFCLAFSLMFFQSSFVFSQEKIQPKVVYYKNWSLVCAEAKGIHSSNSDRTANRDAADGDKKLNCSLSQRLSATDAREVVFAVSVLPAAKKGQYAAILSAPLGGYLAPGMELKIDRGKPFKVLFETCNAGGCHGGFELGGRILKEMQSGKDLTIRLWTSKDKPVDVRIDLDGFGSGFASLKERS
jgi:invasion protein IalB